MGTDGVLALAGDPTITSTGLPAAAADKPAAALAVSGVVGQLGRGRPSARQLPSATTGAEAGPPGPKTTGCSTQTTAEYSTLSLHGMYASSSASALEAREMQYSTMGNVEAQQLTGTLELVPRYYNEHGFRHPLVADIFAVIRHHLLFDPGLASTAIALSSMTAAHSPPVLASSITPTQHTAHVSAIGTPAPSTINEVTASSYAIAASDVTNELVTTNVGDPDVLLGMRYYEVLPFCCLHLHV